MLAAAAEKAKSIDPVKVARRASKKAAAGPGERVERQQGQHAPGRSSVLPSRSTFPRWSEPKTREPFDEEKTGWGWKSIAKIDTLATMLPTTCKMERPN